MVVLYKKSGLNSTDSSVCRSDLNGKNEQVLISDAGGICVVYNKMLYYKSKDGLMFVANPDGTMSKQLSDDIVSTFIICNGKLIYIDENLNIKIANTDGSNMKIVKPESGISILS